MSLPETLAGLLDPGAFPHASEPPTVVETHISWVLLTGSFAYKLKKPVRFDFVDFSTLERREHFCREELRCNRAFAPELYLDVVPVTRDDRGRARIQGGGDVVDWAVKMRQFASDQQLEALLEQDALDVEALRTFGNALAAVHQAAPARRCSATELDARVLSPVRDNFRVLASLPELERLRERLSALRAHSERDAETLRRWLVGRLEEGRIRECHGDLHFGNLVLLDGAVTAFDCLEFDPALRWIDPVSDVAFLFMDCLVRGRYDLGYAFLDGYLDVAGDYPGVRLLSFYADYRAMVRAKVTALREAQLGAEGPGESASNAAQKWPVCATYLAWCEARHARPPGRLVLMFGLSGSGKSHLAARLAPTLPAVRLRSDVARKALAGLDTRAPAAARVGEGLYREDVTAAVYDHLADVAGHLLASGEHVIVDATFLDAERRSRFAALAEALGSRATVMWCDAPVDVLQQRIEARAAAGGEASDADLAVLEAQRRRFRPPTQNAVRVDTAAAVDAALLGALRRSVLDAG